MPSDPEKYILHQGGGLPPLGLGDIDGRLVRRGKNIEDISDPRARLFVLRTVIGQYHASADYSRQELGDGIQYTDLQRSQVLTAWIHESRRVLPQERLTDIDNDPFCKRLLDDVERGDVITAFQEMLQLNEEMPDWVHPDTKFDVMERMRFAVRDTMLEELILRHMLDETIPGGAGECDNPERLRRYLILEKSDAPIGAVIDDFFLGLTRPDADSENLDFFDTDIVDTATICQIVVDRGYSDVAYRMLGQPGITLEQELLLLGVFDQNTSE